MVQIAGLSTIKENGMYTRKVTRLSNEGQVEVPSIILVSQYKEIITPEVFDYLREKCEHTKGASLIHVPGNNNVKGNKSALESLLIGLDPVIRAHFASRNDELRAFVYRKTNAPDEATGNRRYLHVAAGILTDDFLRQAVEKNMDMQKLLTVPQIKEMGLGLEWDLTLTIDDDVLPVEQEVQTLLRHGVSRSRTVQVTPAVYDASEVAAVVHMVYEACKEQSAIGQFKDVRNQVLEELAIAPVIALLQQQQQVKGE